MKQIQTTFQDLINRSYQAIKKRDCINNETCDADFYDKITEEFNEFDLAFLYDSKISEREELIDLITASIMYLHHNGYNFEDEFLKGIEKNEQRAKS